MNLAATDYPLLNAFWTIMIFMAWFLWIWIAITIFMDIFRRHDVGGWAKAGWVLLIFLVPLIGALIYLVSQGHSMAERRATEAADAQSSFDNYVKTVAASSNGQSASEIGKAKELLDSGAITPDEYESLKRKALAS